MPKLPDERLPPPKWSDLPALISWAFDAISIEFLDRLPNAVTVGAIAVLFAVSEVIGILILRAIGWAQDGLSGILPAALISVVTAIPVAGFGQMQYRRARSAYFDVQRLVQELIIARDEAQSANAEKSKFLASMSHELRTPLNAIIGFSEIIKAESLGAIGVKKYLDYANDIYKSGLNLLELINDVLDLSRVEAGRFSIDMEAETDLRPILLETCQTMSVMAEKNGVRLQSRCIGAIRARTSDRVIRQILLNLISNAIKFTADEGSVVVSLTAKEQGAVFEVRDTGIGMTPQEQKIALQPFGQVDSYCARKHKGTGLGLPLVNAMVRMHGGQLIIDSRPNEGTTVSFNIPPDRLVAGGTSEDSSAFEEFIVWSPILRHAAV